MTEAATDTIRMVPKEWPGAFGLYKHSKQAVKFNLGTILLLGLSYFAVSIFAEALDLAEPAISFLAGAYFTASLTLAYLASVRNHKMSFDEALKKAWPFLVKVVFFNLLSTVIAVVSLLLLVVPFFIVMPRIALANYFLIDKNMGVWESFKASWEASRGHAGKVWGIFGVNLLMCLLIFTLIGIPVAIYLLIMYSAALVVLYEFVGKHGSAAAKS